MSLQSVPGTIVSGLEQSVVSTAAAALAQTGTRQLFTVVGTVHVLQIVGVVTTAIQAQANATKLQAVVAALTAVDLCATGDINGLAVGTILMPATSFATALAVSSTNGVQVAITPTAFIMGAGVIRENCAASNTGNITWYIRYRPLSPGAYIQ